MNQSKRRLREDEGEANRRAAGHCDWTPCFTLRSTSAKHHKASGSRIPEPAVVTLNLKVSQCGAAFGSSPADRSDVAKPSGYWRFRRRSLWDGRRPVHVHRLTERERTQKTGGSAPTAVAQHVSPLRLEALIRRHLHVQLQDIRVRLQQLTHVGFGASEVSVDKLLDVAVGWR